MDNLSAPIRIEPGRLIVRLPYTPERVAKIKTVEGRRTALHSVTSNDRGAS